jgi:hypothetical protein
MDITHAHALAHAHTHTHTLTHSHTHSLTHTHMQGRLDFGPVGEGAAPIYHVKSIFDASPAANKRGPSSCMGSSSRFEGIFIYV